MDSNVSELVELAFTLDRRIKSHTARLEACKEQLRAAARSKAKPGVKLEGQTVELVGQKGNVAKVEFLGIGLIRTGFWLQGEEAWAYRGNKKVRLGNVVKLAGKYFNELFRKVYKPKGNHDEFKLSCETLVGGNKARDLIEMFKEDQTPRVSFEDKISKSPGELVQG